MHLVALLLVVIVHVRTIHFLEKIILRSANLMDQIFLWKNQMCDAVVQRRQMRPLGGKAKKPDDMDNDDRKEVDALTMSTIRLHLADSVYFTGLTIKSPKNFGKRYAIQSVFD